ncbi:winged helix-turn-helix domain-containing protein [Ornithinimicrobium sp. LYQ92]|uniref:winged helix-turn-helix domain-containing protein n=1 Tax=Serinicoccus sp. LYQ92 TaxID=3378798 RepID=UPI0038524847
MSVQAVAWAIDAEKTGPLSAEARLVLVVMADRADKEGRNVYLSAGRMARTLGTTDRSVRRHLSALRKAGVIVPGDPEVIPDYYRHDRRPVVYNLPINRELASKRFLAGIVPPDDWNAEEGEDIWAEEVKPRQNMPREWMASFEATARPDSNVIPLRGHGVTAVTGRPDSTVRHGVTAVSPKTVFDPPSIPTSLSSSFILTCVRRAIGSLDLGSLRNDMMPLRAGVMA